MNSSMVFGTGLVQNCTTTQAFALALKQSFVNTKFKISGYTAGYDVRPLCFSKLYIQKI